MKPFTRNEGGEQIDGAFVLDGWHYLVEARWREKAADIRQLDGLKGQIERSGHQTMGIYVSVNGWSGHVPDLLKQNPKKVIILMDGDDFHAVLSGRIDLQPLLRQKVQKLNFYGEPFIGAAELLTKRKG